jgi:hypothetical protein
MRLAVILILLSLRLTAQTDNEIIWNYANDHLGQKVGGGLCIDLVKGAYKQICNCRIERRSGLRKWRYRLGQEIPKDSLMPGDVVQIRRFDKATNKEMSGHIAIVYAISETNISVIHQNWTDSREVTITIWSDLFDVGDEITQTFKYYRPF